MLTRCFGRVRVAALPLREGERDPAEVAFERRSVVRFADGKASPRGFGGACVGPSLQQAPRQSIFGALVLEPCSCELPEFQSAFRGDDHPLRFFRIAIRLFLEARGQVVARDGQRAKRGRARRQAGRGERQGFGIRGDRALVLPQGGKGRCGRRQGRNAIFDREVRQREADVRGVAEARDAAVDHAGNGGITAARQPAQRHQEVDARVPSGEMLAEHMRDELRERGNVGRELQERQRAGETVRDFLGAIRMILPRRGNEHFDRHGLASPRLWRRCESRGVRTVHGRATLRNISVSSGSAPRAVRRSVPPVAKPRRSSMRRDRKLPRFATANSIVTR